MSTFSVRKKPSEDDVREALTVGGAEIRTEKKKRLDKGRR